MDHAAALVLLADPHGQVRAAVGVEISSRQRATKAIACLGHTADPGTVL
jgi:hypothetical protein